MFEVFSLDEYREANELRWDKAGHQKQYRIEQMDRDIVDRVKTKLGLEDVEMLHPGPMYPAAAVFLVREGRSRDSEAAHRAQAAGAR